MCCGHPSPPWGLGWLWPVVPVVKPQLLHFAYTSLSRCHRPLSCRAGPQKALLIAKRPVSGIRMLTSIQYIYRTSKAVFENLLQNYFWLLFHRYFQIYEFYCLIWLYNSGQNKDFFFFLITDTFNLDFIVLGFSCQYHNHFSKEAAHF